MNVLVVNAGSSSLKYQLLDTDTREVFAKGNCERIGSDMGIFGHSENGGAKQTEEVPFPDAVPALRELRRRGYSLGILANQVAGLPERLAQRGMGGLFAVIVTSAEFGAKKPDAALFEAALRQAGCLPAEAAMVGDRLDNDIAPAKRLGMRTVRILQGYGALSRPRNDWEEPEETVRTLAELPELFQEDKGETE